MIEIKGICKSFKDKEVLRDLNIEIPDGKVFGLVGINGAGKSTLLRIIAGIYRPDNGEVIIDGENNYENEFIKSKLFFLPDEPYYSINTTPLSIIELYKVFYNLDKEAYLNYLKEFDIPVNKSLVNFSKGMKRQVFVSLAMAIKPKYLLLDEAFDGLDPLARLTFKRMLIDLIEDNNSTIILSSHSLRELEDICDSYGLLDNMTIVSSGDINESINQMHKYQLAFQSPMKQDDFNDIEFIKFESDGRIVRAVTNLDYETFSKKIEKHNPLIIDEIEIDFEELFMIEVESRGYVK